MHSIESAILQTSPGDSESTFLIDRKKVITVDGVRHEIDLWVDVLRPRGYESRFIFECKNWEAKKVGKNDVIVFSEKVRAVNAQLGYFVARSFSKDARAQARQDRRVELLLAKEHPIAAAAASLQLRCVIEEKSDTELLFGEVGAGVSRMAVNLETTNIVLYGEPLDIKQYVRAWNEQERAKIVNSLSEGVHDIQIDAERKFGPRELIVGGREVSSARIRTDIRLRISPLQVRSHYEIASRGRVVGFVPVPLGTGSITISLVTT